MKWVRNTRTATAKWVTLRFRVAGPRVEGYLYDTRYLEHTLPAPVSGRVGV